MCRQFNWCLETIIIIILSMLSLFYISYRYESINLLDFLTLILAVIAIFITWYIHKSKQINLLETCLQEIRLIIEDSKGFKKEIEKNSLPLYFMKETSSIEFSTSLDARIIWVKTIDLKKLLFKINDKVKLVNGYLDKILEDYFNYLRVKKYKNENTAWNTFTKNSQIYTYLNPRLNPTITNLDKYLNEAKCIINERFNIR